MYENNTYTKNTITITTTTRYYSITRLCNTVLIDHENRVWVGQDEGAGLLRLQKTPSSGLQAYQDLGYYKTYKNEDKNANSLSSSTINCLFQDAQKTIWVGTDAGLNALDIATEKIRRYTVEQGLPSNAIASIVQDDKGFLWIATSKGLSKMDLKTNKFQNFSEEADGLQSNSFNIGSVLKTRDGNLVFGGINGFNLFHPDSIKFNKRSPTVSITAFQISGKEYMKNDTVINFVSVIDLPDTVKELRFEFAALDFSNPTFNRYQYRLVGYDNVWRDAVNQHYAAYTNLSHGDYTFEVRATNNDGVWSEQPAALTVRIATTWWAQWWAQGLGIALLFGFFYAIFRGRIRYLENQRKKMEKIVVERTAELVKRNEEISTQKEELHALSEELAKKNGVILHDTKAHLNTLIASTRNLFAPHPELKSMQEEMSNLLYVGFEVLNLLFFHAKEARVNVPLHGVMRQFLSNQSEELAAIGITVTVKRLDEINIGSQEFITNLVYMVNQLLLNVAKHAFTDFEPPTPKTVSISMQKTEQGIELQVADNGRGLPADFDLNLATYQNSFGLSFAKERAEKLNASLTYQSEPEQGTSWNIILPLKSN